MHMTYESMIAFAESWIAAWNRRDVEAVLAHYSERRSPSATARNNFSPLYESDRMDIRHKQGWHS
jgi:hypothetical protein